MLATGNAGKLREVRALLAALPIRLLGLAELPGLVLPEEGDDYADNAIAKARAAARGAARLALADDSGLEVEALGGAPGPHSARFGPDDAARNARLLAALAGVPAERRGARFVCVAALAAPDGAVVTARGECPGRILAAPRGRGGFGYDPLFEPAPGVSSAPAGHSLAELAPAEKDRISHRGRAFRALLPALAARLR